MQKRLIHITTKPTYITSTGDQDLYAQEIENQIKNVPDDFYPWLAKVFALTLLAESIMLVILMQSI